MKDKTKHVFPIFFKFIFLDADSRASTPLPEPFHIVETRKSVLNESDTEESSPEPHTSILRAFSPEKPASDS